MRKKITISSRLAPAIFVSPATNKTYVVPTWTEVPRGTTLKDIVWDNPFPPAPMIQPKPTRKFVTGSKGNKYVVTTWPNGNKTCTCDGFSYRRTCRHLGM